MWSEELDAVRARFREIGASHQDETRRCWFAREFPGDLWSELGREGVFAAITRDRGGLEAGSP